MNLDEACQLLGVSPDTSKDEVKKSFRKLAVKYHPDNKTTGDEAKFKQLNEANQLLESFHNGTYNQGPAFQAADPFSGFPFNIDDILGGFGVNRQQPPRPRVDNINIGVELSFKDSVLGCKRDITYDRLVKCDGCSGTGRRQRRSNCKPCGGMGVIVARQGFAVIQRVCPACGGKQVFDPCGDCGTNGSRKITVTNTVKIPAGVKSGVTLKIDGAGNYAGEHVAGDMYSSILLRLNVENDQDLRLQDKDVISTVSVTLLEALMGTQKEIRTIQGFELIDIPSHTKHSDQVIVKGEELAPPGGVHRVLVNVDYPSNVNDLIDFLKENKN